MPDEPRVAEAGDGDPVDTYPLEYSDHEFARLERQATIFRGFTADVLRRAGLVPGMQVLDIG